MRVKFKLGELVRFRGKLVRVITVRFTCNGVMYKVVGNRNWIRESELEYANKRNRVIRNNTKSKEGTGKSSE